MKTLKHPSLSFGALVCLALLGGLRFRVAAGEPSEAEAILPPGFTLKNGDVNADGQVDLSDAVYLLAWKFTGGPPPAPLSCKESKVQNGDANGDGDRDISDAVYILEWKFTGGPGPVAACAPASGGPAGADLEIEGQIAGQASAAVAVVGPAPEIPGLTVVLPEVRILDLNIAGVAIQEGGDISAYVLYKIQQLDANVVTLQEVCSAQASGVLGALPGWSCFFKMNTILEPTDAEPGCGGSHKFGLATFVKGEYTNPEWWELPYSDPEFGWSKFLTKIRWSGYNIYNTHLRAFGAEFPDTTYRNRMQFEFVVETLRTPLVLAGDFNAPGRTIAGLREIDADQERTWQEFKIDYIFTSGTPQWGDAQDSISNHRILKGTIR